MNKIPNHVAIIMDGNGRWATRKGLPRTAGHKKGSENLKKLAIYILNKGVKYLSVFAFSTENFKRSKEEVNFLMDMFAHEFKKEMEIFNKNNIKIIFSGRKEPLRNDVIEAMNEITEKTKNNTAGVFNVCLNYGGQAEIVDASKNIARLFKNNELDIETITTETFYKYLYNELPAIDLLIRTSGEIRISNFMLYNLSYAELYFTDICFPEFNEKEFDKALDYFDKRNITKGEVK